MPITRLRATSGRTTVSPPTAWAVARMVRVAVLMLSGASWSRLRVDVDSAARWPASEGAAQIRAPGVGTGSGGAILESRALRPSMRSSSSWRTYERYGSEDWSAIV
ncbi:hypothetical protein SMICM304S_07934 [Streptomyces microflavus]